MSLTSEGSLRFLVCPRRHLVHRIYFCSQVLVGFLQSVIVTLKVAVFRR